MQYDLNVRKYQYIRSSYYIETNKGKFILRRVDLPKDQISFCYEVDRYIKSRGFSNLNSIYTTKKNLPYALVGEQYYMMQSYVLFEETDFKNFEDLRNTVSILAYFHKAARGVESLIRTPEEIRIKNIYEYYIKRKAENGKLKKSISRLRQKSRFEMMFLQDSEAYRELEERALLGISKELIDDIIYKSKKERHVAHKDYTYHTVNKSKEGYYLINQIDTCNYDIQILDLAQILIKIMQKNSWNYDVLYYLIEEYNRICPLTMEEFKLLKFKLIYPEKYNSICYKYISSKRRWNYSMFEQKWENMMAYKEHQMRVAKIIDSW